MEPVGRPGAGQQEHPAEGARAVGMEAGCFFPDLGEDLLERILGLFPAEDAGQNPQDRRSAVIEQVRQRLTVPLSDPAQQEEVSFLQLFVYFPSSIHGSESRAILDPEPVVDTLSQKQSRLDVAPVISVVPKHSRAAGVSG